MTEEFYIVKIKIQLHSKQILLPFDESFSCKVPKRYVNYGMRGNIFPCWSVFWSMDFFEIRSVGKIFDAISEFYNCPHNKRRSNSTIFHECFHGYKGSTWYS